MIKIAAHSRINSSEHTNRETIERESSNSIPRDIRWTRSPKTGSCQRVAKILKEPAEILHEHMAVPLATAALFAVSFSGKLVTLMTGEENVGG